MTEILTVSALNRAVSATLDRQFPMVWVVGEISNFTKAASGHWYFTLKDVGAQVRAVMFKGRAQLTDLVPKEGDRVEIRCRPGLYEPRGDFQLNVEFMRRAGVGDLHQEFERLKRKLMQEGLFEAARKKTLLEHPRAIGVVTSAQGAALRDVLTTLHRKAPHVPVVVFPCLVQGASAPAAIIKAIGHAVALTQPLIDVLLIVRGGGAIEDLWAFNDEALARVIADCPVTTISGVGHETDFTICDFVADFRAATPTAAASLAAPDRALLLREVNSLSDQLSGSTARIRNQARQRLDYAQRLLRSPRERLTEQNRQIEQCWQRLGSRMATRLRVDQHRVALAWSQLSAPNSRLAEQNLAKSAQRLKMAVQHLTQTEHTRLKSTIAALNLVSPRAVLARGYAVVQTDEGRVLSQSDQAQIGQSLHVVLEKGQLQVNVSKKVS